jgi:DNA polymerase III subunit epsilon
MKGGADGGGCFPTGRHYPGIAHLLRVVAAGLADECSSDTTVSDLTIVAIDTETTGRDPASDRIVEVACVAWRGGRVASRRAWLVNPGCPIPKEAFDVHGISDEEVSDKAPFSEVAQELLTELAGAVPLAYNAEFDRAFLSAELARAAVHSESPPPACRKGVQWIDPLIWARELYKMEKGKSLGEVCARLGVEVGQAHRATDDAEAALHVLARFLADPRVPKTYGAFVQEQRRLARLHDEERARWRARSN